MQKCFEIRPVTKGDYDTLKKLWLNCFDDEYEVIEQFFEKTADPCNIIATFYGNEAINAMYLLESSINIEGKLYSAYYIYAVCTEPSYRGAGIMKKAFSHLENLVNSRGIDYIFLVPATEGLFSMYEKLGFKTGLTYSEEFFYKNNLTSKVEIKPCLDYEAFCFYRKKYPCDVPLITLGQTAFNSFYSPVEDSVSCLCNDDGYAVCEKEHDRVVVHELFGNKAVLIAAAMNHYKIEKIVLRGPCIEKDGKPFGMYRSFGAVPEIKNAFFGIPYGV